MTVFAFFLLKLQWAILICRVDVILAGECLVLSR